ncbi:MAG: hypothetical protein SFT91_05515 [Rickettsiaceae bacterium]|nr:hypothetical protein [Rickettsiaceae bacterium]
MDSSKDDSKNIAAEQIAGSETNKQPETNTGKTPPPPATELTNTSEVSGQKATFNPKKPMPKGPAAVPPAKKAQQVVADLKSFWQPPDKEESNGEVFPKDERDSNDLSQNGIAATQELNENGSSTTTDSDPDPVGAKTDEDKQKYKINARRKQNTPKEFSVHDPELDKLIVEGDRAKVKEHILKKINENDPKYLEALEKTRITVEEVKKSTIQLNPDSSKLKMRKSKILQKKVVAGAMVAAVSVGAAGYGASVGALGVAPAAFVNSQIAAGVGLGSSGIAGVTGLASAGVAGATGLASSGIAAGAGALGAMGLGTLIASPAAIPAMIVGVGALVLSGPIGLMVLAGVGSAVITGAAVYAIYKGIQKSRAKETLKYEALLNQIIENEFKHNGQSPQDVRKRVLGNPIPDKNKRDQYNQFLREKLEEHYKNETLNPKELKKLLRKKLNSLGDKITKDDIAKEMKRKGPFNATKRISSKVDILKSNTFIAPSDTNNDPSKAKHTAKVNSEYSSASLGRQSSLSPTNSIRVSTSKDHAQGAAK